MHELHNSNTKLYRMNRFIVGYNFDTFFNNLFYDRWKISSETMAIMLWTRSKKHLKSTYLKKNNILYIYKTRYPYKIMSYKNLKNINNMFYHCFEDSFQFKKKCSSENKMAG